MQKLPVNIFRVKHSHFYQAPKGSIIKARSNAPGNFFGFFKEREFNNSPICNGAGSQPYAPAGIKWERYISLIPKLLDYH
jgi:hypothetical protein